MASARADCTNIARERSRLRRIKDPSVGTQAVYQPIKKVPGSRKLTSGGVWVTVTPVDIDAIVPDA
jgi:hypothetical protein